MEKKNILITLLTSNNLIYLNEAYKCIINQQNITMKYTLAIIVNTLNDDYYNDVIRNFPNDNIIRTESNGYAGKGHNSVLTYFKNHPEYEYIITLDGDDFLYPYALHHLEKYIKSPYNPDVLILPFTDKLLFNCPISSLHYPIHNKCYLYYDLQTDQLNSIENLYRDKLNPFTHNLNNMDVPGRIIFLSRKSLELNLYYDEQLALFDDLYPFLQLLEYNTISSKYNIFFLKQFDFYIYNCLNNQSISTIFHKNKVKIGLDTDKLFRKTIKDKFLSIRNYDLRSITILQNNIDIDLFPLTEKIKWVEKLVHNFNLPDIKINYGGFQNIKAFFLKDNTYSGLATLYDKP